MGKKVSTVVFVYPNTVDVYKRVQQGDHVEYHRVAANVSRVDEDKKPTGVLPAFVGAVTTFVLGLFK
jgi:hypothetical protein